MMPAHPRAVHFFHPYFRDGGVERTIAILSREFRSRGVQTETVTLGVAAEDSRSRVDGAPTLTDLGVRRAVCAILPLAKHLRRHRPAVLLAFQSYGNVIAVLANLLAGRPTRVIVSERTALSLERGTHAALRHNNPLKDRVLLALMRVCYRKADLVSANSIDGARDVERMLGLPTDSVRVLYNPTFEPTVRLKACAPLTHPFFDSPAPDPAQGKVPILVAAGRLNPQKDFATLLHAFALLRAQHPCRLIIVGEGSERAVLEALATTLGIKADVDFPGFDPNPWRYMARADVFVLSSLWEGLPNVLIEAVALGVPAVSTDCLSGPREILLEGRGGLLVPPGDAVRLAAALRETLVNPLKAQALARAAQSGLSRFETAPAVETYLQTMNQVIENSAWVGARS